MLWQRQLRDDPTLDPTARLVGVILSTYMDGAGRAQVSRSTLARGCGLADVSSVKRAVHRLEAAGLLGVDRVKGGAHAANSYQLRSNGGWPAPVHGGASAPVGPDQRGLRSRPTGALAPHERKGLETIAGAPAREEVHERGEGEGYGSAEGARLAVEAARAARAALQAGRADPF